MPLHRDSFVEIRPARPLFEENASVTLARVQRIFRERGDQYGDTWRHSQHLILRAVYKELFGEELPKKFCRALAAAVLCDVKYQRNEGGYKEDSLDDGINYQAFLAEEMRKLKEEAVSSPECLRCNDTGLTFPLNPLDGNAPCPDCRRIVSAPRL